MTDFRDKRPMEVLRSTRKDEGQRHEWIGRYWSYWSGATTGAKAALRLERRGV